ncbi:MAG: flagellar biosynthesis repressor FlbT [Alphaproteobacteria bacterium]|nr:flagellar biosynthesis repressor FlbT [Alphaproteobacteria bacterium]
MALKISLKPGEKFVINGAVIQNGERRTNLVLHNKASILREKDILLPENAQTPVRRIYFAIMMMYLDPDAEKAYHQEFVRRVAEFINAIRNPAILTDCITIIDNVYSRDFYGALLTCKKLLPYEQERLDFAARHAALEKVMGAKLTGDGAEGDGEDGEGAGEDESETNSRRGERTAD